MPTSTAMTASSGHWRVSAAKTAALLTPRPRSSRARRAFSACQSARRAATSGRWSVAASSWPSASPSANSRRDDGQLAPHRHGHRVELAELQRIEVDLDDRLARVDAGVVGERRTEHDEQVGLVHEPARHRRAAAAEHARGQRMVVGDDALGLERRDDRRVQALGERRDGRHVLARAVADDEHRPARGAHELKRVVDLLLRGRDVERREPPGRAARRLVRGGDRLHVVGEDEVRDVALEDGVLAGEVHQLRVPGAGLHGLTPGRDRRERRGEVDLLEGPRAEHLRLDLAGQRQQRRAVDLRVVQAGEQVRRARARDRQAGGGAAGELRVGRGGEGGRALVADADVPQGAGLLLAADRVGEAEVRMADHPEDRVDAPGDHRLGHRVGRRCARARPPARCRRRYRRRGSRSGTWPPCRRSRRAALP